MLLWYETVFCFNLADSIGDNRFSSEVDRELLEDAVKLGYKYCNALFELKNHPKDLVYWRMKVLDSLYCQYRFEFLVILNYLRYTNLQIHGLK